MPLFSVDPPFISFFFFLMPLSEISRASADTARSFFSASYLNALKSFLDILFGSLLLPSGRLFLGHSVQLLLSFSKWDHSRAPR